MSPPPDIAAVRPVGFWARLLAALIDAVLVLFIVVPITLWIFGDGWAYTEGVVAFVVNWGLPGAACIAFWMTRQATPGLMAIKAVVVDADTHAPLDFWQALTRYVGCFVSFMPACLGFLWVALDARKQGWHDKMARTVVIYRPR